MRLLPKSKAGKIEFCQVRVAKWAEFAAQIGADPALVAELAAKTEAAKSLLSQQQIAQQRAQSATLAADMAIDELANLTAAVVLQIRAHARSAGEGVFALALIPPPKKRRSPIGPPGKPFGFAHVLQSDGSLELRWKCKYPRGATGTMYHISRQLGGAGKFDYLDAVGERKFVDVTVPPGSSLVTYRVRAFRSTRQGPLGEHIVHYGGGFMPSFGVAEAPRQAA